MPTEAKTHHFSDIDTWKHPDRNYFNFIVISVLFGLFGLDHFYVRSFKTGGLKILLNVFGLGIWYFWDLIQIFHNSAKVRAEGLDTPFDWFGGIGRGVFVELKEGMEPPEIAKSYKDFFVYGLLTIFLGILGIDKFYLGDTEKGLIKMLSIVSIYPILLGLIWVIYDIYVVLFNPQSIIDDGITTPFPFSMFPWLQKSPDKLGDMFMPKMGGEKREFDYEAHQKNFGDSMLLIWNWPPVKAMIDYYSKGGLAGSALSAAGGPAGAAALAGLAGGPAGALALGALTGKSPLAAIAGPGALAGKSPLAAGPGAALGALGASPLAAVASPLAAVASPLSAAAGIPTAPPAAAFIPTAPRQRGGALETDSSGPVIAGTLTAIVLAGGLKAITSFL